jgi:transcriptional regulator with XRE-family HTH domain
MPPRTLRNPRTRDGETAADWKTDVRRANDLAAASCPGEAAQTTASTLAAIGLRIRERRQARGMTLQALAATTNLSPSMLSLVERGRASPSIGSLVVIANALRVAMSDLIVYEPASDEKLVVRSSDQHAIETAQHVVRRLLREDGARGVSVAINEYEQHTGNAENAVTHDGFEYGYILEGKLTVEVDGASYQLEQGDLIAYSSRRPHRFRNHGRKKVRTLWFNLKRE